MKLQHLNKILDNINNKDCYNLLQLDMLILQAELLDLISAPDVIGVNQEKMVDLLERFMSIYEKIASLSPGDINHLFDIEEVSTIEERYNELINSLSFPTKGGLA